MHNILTESDSSGPCIIGYDSSSSRCGPAVSIRRPNPEASRFPRKELPHMPGSATTPGRTDARVDASVHVAFREDEHVGARDFQVFAAQWLAYVLPYRRASRI